MALKLELQAARFYEWLHVKNYSERTIDDYKCYLRQFIDYLEKETSVAGLHDIDSQTIYGYQNHLYHARTSTGKRLSLESQAKKLTAVKRFFEYLIETGDMVFNPASVIKLPKMKKHLPKGVMSEQQVEDLLEQIDTSTPLGVRDRAMIELLYATAIRNSELRQLAVYDVDPQQLKLTVRHGKGKKDRVVPMGEIACDYVQEYLQTIRPKLIVLNPDQDLLFVSKHGKQITRANLIWIIHKYVKQTANLPKDVGPHSLRHSCATHMLRRGADLRYVQQLLGHASISTTQIYTQVDDADLKAVHRRCHPRELI